jgi:hypothetical protein
MGDSGWRHVQGQAEGDVLENIVNALADLILGPQIKAQRLNGSPDGNTWNLGNTTVGAADYGRFTGADGKTYSGRDAFYAKLKADHRQARLTKPRSPASSCSRRAPSTSPAPPAPTTSPMPRSPASAPSYSSR